MQENSKNELYNEMSSDGNCAEKNTENIYVERNYSLD